GVVVDPARLFTVFQFEHTSRTNRCANPTSYTRSPNDVLPPLGIPAHIDSHFAVGGATATGYALPAIGGDSEAGFESLDNANICSQGAAKPAPHPIAHKRIKSYANHSGKSGSNQKTIPFVQHAGAPSQKYKNTKSTSSRNISEQHDYYHAHTPK